MKKYYRLFFFIVSSTLSFTSFAQTGQVSINRVDQMPDLPSPYLMRDWKDVTIKYDDFVFSTNKTGQYLPLLRLKTNSINYPSLQPILLQTYVGGSTSSAEAINIMPAVVGASLVGINKSNQSGVNWVEKTKDFFNKANQQNVYLNNYSAISGGDWWYDVMPNVLFYQLYSQYPGTSDFQNQFTTIADRWLDAVQHMGGASAPWTVPNMNYRGWYLATMTGNSQSVMEPESAGSIGWLLYNAYLKTGDKKYLDGAQMALEFLSNLSANPSYELQLPYGTFIAAKMNAEQGTNYNIDKMLNWSFDRGPLRGWGTIVGKWDGKDVSGLIGEANDGGTDYAFLMNGFQQAAMFVPLVKYDKRYARAIAKWTLNLANASRYFYSTYLPTDKQDDFLWSSTNDPESVIAYEALKEKNNFDQNKPLYGTGDAKRSGWASTNLGLYGSSHVGYLGSILETTDVSGILKLDVNKTDFFGKNSFPTYLVYNPYTDDKQVTLSLGGNTYDIYDAISEQIISTSATGDVSISINANEALLLSYLPAGSNPVARDGKLVIGEDVIDFHYGYNFTPALRIKSLATKNKNYPFAGQATVYAAVDNASSPISYQWYVNNVLTTTTTEGTFNWTTPSVEGEYNIVLKATSGAASIKDSLKLSVWKVVPAVPQITSIITTKKYFTENQPTSLIAKVASAGTEKLTYQWNVTSGTTTIKDSLLNWTPTKEGLYSINCTVTNHYNLQSTYTLQVLVKKTQTGMSDATAYYPFDGDVKDYSGHGFNAQSSGVKLTEDKRGSINSAYQFTSGTDIIFVPNQLSLNFVDAITLSFWVKATQISQESFILSHGSWEERWKISIIPNGKLRWTTKTTNGTVDLDSSKPLALNEFHHVTILYSGYSMELYVDGELDTFAAQSGSLSSTTKAITFGQKDQSEAGYYLNGTLDEVRIYNKSLVPDEIALLKTLWNGEIITGLETENNLVAYPNPANHGKFSINASFSDIRTILLTDLSGRLVDFKTNGYPDKTEIEVNSDFKGILILKVSLDHSISQQKIILK